jgi:hypothetical protein
MTERIISLFVNTAIALACDQLENHQDEKDYGPHSRCFVCGGNERRPDDPWACIWQWGGLDSAHASCLHRRLVEDEAPVTEG